MGDKGVVRWWEKQVQEPGDGVRRFSQGASMAKTEGSKCGGKKKWGLMGRQGQTWRVLGPGEESE